MRHAEQHTDLTDKFQAQDTSERPYLEFVTTEANVSISSTGLGPVTEADLATAHEIFNAAAHYLAECERLHSEITDKAA